MASVAILNGGRARRFDGRDKSAIVVEGRTILERQLDQAAALTDDILLVGATSASADRRLRAVVDRQPECGPLGGLDAALAAARDEQVVLLAGDMPFVSADFLRHLLAHAEGVDAVVPRTERGYHPLCAVYMRRCRAAVAARLAHRDLKMLDLLNWLQVHTIDRDEIAQFGNAARLLANVNTAADLNDLGTLIGHEL